jgi:hypothetical protein
VAIRKLAERKIFLTALPIIASDTQPPMFNIAAGATASKA